MSGLMLLWSWVLVPQALAETQKARLDHRIEVVVMEQHRAPVVYMELRYALSGLSLRDPGMAHLVEHLAFRGGGDLEDGELDQRLEAAGGESNGWTTADWMALTMRFPPEALAEVLDLESRRFDALTDGLTQEVLRHELEVIAQERASRLASPAYADRLVIRRELYPGAHPYSRSIIGVLEDASLTPSDIAAYAHQLREAPVALVLVGDFEASEVLAQIEHRFGSGAEGVSSPPPVVAPVSLESEQRRFWIDRRGEPALYMVWPTVPAGHVDEPALELLGAVLALGPGSTLERALWRRRVGLCEVAMRAESYPLAGEFQLAIHGCRGSQKSILERVDREIRRLKIDGPDPEELERARSWLAQRKSLEQYDYQFLASELAQKSLGPESPAVESSAIGPEDLAEVATRWLGEGRLVLAILPPEESDRAPADSLQVYGP